MTNLTVAIGSRTVRIAVSDQAIAALLDDILADLSTDADPDLTVSIGAGPDGKYVLGLGDGTERAVVDRALVVDHLMSWANQEAVASRTDHVCIHAAGLVEPTTGRAVLAPAAPARGKSTLALGLLRRGWSYLSDEVVAIDTERLTAEAYPKPVTLKPGTRALVDLPAGRTISPRQQRWYVRPDELGGAVARSALPAGLLFARYRRGAPTVATDIGPTEATLELAENCQDQLDPDGRLLLVLARLAARCHRRRLVHADLDVVCDEAEALIETAPPDPSPVRLLELHTVLPRRGPARRPATAAVELDDGMLLHDTTTQRLVALDPLGGVVWSLLDGATTLEDLAGELARAYGAPAATVAGDVGQLIEHLVANDVVALPR